MFETHSVHSQRKWITYTAWNSLVKSISSICQTRKPDCDNVFHCIMLPCFIATLTSQMFSWTSFKTSSGVQSLFNYMFTYKIDPTNLGQNGFFSVVVHADICDIVSILNPCQTPPTCITALVQCLCGSEFSVIAFIYQMKILHLHKKLAWHSWSATNFILSSLSCGRRHSALC